MSDEITGLDLVAVADAIRARQLSAEEVVRACIARAERVQDRLNTFISLDAEGAIEAARAADQALAQGREVGRLHGIPVAHKDMFYRQGRVVTCGSRLRRDFRPAFTASALERLDQAGAIDLGGLNMSEFACNPYGMNVLVGRAKNPWALERIAGGSSSGSAAAVASRLLYGSLGSDTGGSVRLPAAICGVVGLLPTNGRISRHGVMKLSFSLDNAGPLTRTVRDCARLLGVVAGADASDPTASTAPVPDYEADIDAPIAGRRIGIPARHFYDGVADDVRAALDASLDVLRAAGAELIEVEVPDPAPYDALANTIILAEAAAIHAEWMRTRAGDYTPLVLERIAVGFSVPATAYIEALSVRGRLLAEFLETVFPGLDALFTPMLVQPPPTMVEVEAMLAEKADLTFDLARNTRLFNYLGLPALSVPCGFGDDGLPIAFQLVGRPFAEPLLFNLGHAYQSATGHHRKAPLAA
jgi:aspartyl-tRNA(Asn)/glutamyl-tRNA(Gln) amidotransferase subunit A